MQRLLLGMIFATTGSGLAPLGLGAGFAKKWIQDPPILFVPSSKILPSTTFNAFRQGTFCTCKLRSNGLKGEYQHWRGLAGRRFQRKCPILWQKKDSGMLGQGWMDGQTRSPLKESELSQRVMNSDKVNVEDKWFEEGTLEDSPNDADCDNEYSLPFSKELHDFLVLPITEISVALLVLASCFLVAVETLTVERTYFLIEDTISCIFIAEYFARWYSRGLKPRYLLRWAMIIDFIAILPFGLQLTTGQLGPSGLYTDYTFLRLLRILRLQRFLRNPASFERLIGSVLPVKIQVREFDLQLFRIFDQIFTLLFITSGLIYNAENAANDKFSDFFSAFYFTVITVTTVGFGDIVPITPAGRAITAAAILVGISLIPYQLSNLARIVLEEQSGLKEEKAVQTSMRERQEFVQLTCVECGECLHAKRAKFCLGCGVKLPDGSEEQQYM